MSSFNRHLDIEDDEELPLPSTPIIATYSNRTSTSKDSDKSSYAARFLLISAVACTLGLAFFTSSYFNDASATISSSNIQLAKEGKLAYKKLKDVEKTALFLEFKEIYRRSYSSEDEETIRFTNFKNTLSLIDERNENESKKGSSDAATHGINKYADYSVSEFKSLLGYTAPDKNSAKYKGVKKAPENKGGNKKSDGSNIYDWRGVYTTPIKDQGYCGSCWAFSACSQIESDAIRSSLLTTDDELSEQQLIDCDTYDYGCDGGNPIYAYYYVYKSGGVELNSTYPYVSYDYDYDDETCSASTSDYKVSVTNYYYLSSETDMETHVQETGPLSVCVDASTWSSYTGGVLSSCGTSIDHCVQVVGLNTASNYWIVRNSWGTDWGVDGYIYVKSGDNVCDISYLPTYVSVEAV